MKKKTERLHRLVKKLGSKYGKGDEDVLRLQTELDSLIKLEKADQEVPAVQTAALQAPSPAKRLYMEALRASRQ